MSTTFRTDLRSGIYAVLVAYASANPTQLRSTFRARPPGFNETPCAWVDDSPESIRFDSGTMTRDARPSVLVVDRITDNAETAARFDTLVDGLVEAFAAVPQLGTTGMMAPGFDVTDEDAPLGNYDFRAVRLTWPSASLMEGRP